MVFVVTWYNYFKIILISGSHDRDPKETLVTFCFIYLMELNFIN